MACNSIAGSVRRGLGELLKRKKTQQTNTRSKLKIQLEMRREFLNTGFRNYCGWLWRDSSNPFWGSWKITEKVTVWGAERQVRRWKINHKSLCPSPFGSERGLILCRWEELLQGGKQKLLSSGASWLPPAALSLLVLPPPFFIKGKYLWHCCEHL